MFGERNVVLSENPTNSEIIEATYNIFKTHWKTSYDYNKSKPIFFRSKPLKFKFKRNLDFAIPIIYIDDIGKSFINGSLEDKDDILRNEIIMTEEKGCSCIYTSVLLYLLLDKFDVEKHLVQGFYKYETRKDLPSFFPFSKLQIGLHSFLQFDGIVIDLTVYPQQMYTFDFKGANYILGIIPSGLQLIGYKESRGIVMQYAEDFAKFSGMNLDEWIAYHKNNMNDFYLKLRSEKCV